VTRPLHEQDPTGRFSDRAADYVKHRPSYPAAAIDTILGGLSPGGAGSQPSGTGFQWAHTPSTPVAADIGAGTGISARLLAQRGLHVFAVEPNEAMREAGRRADAAPGAHDQSRGEITWLDGTAESTGLPESSVDLVLCAQSYHWFEPAAACREFGRILRPGGRLALMWNDADESDPVSRGYYDLVREASEGAGPTSHQRVAKAPRVEPPFRQDDLRRLRFRNEQRLDAYGLIGRAMSASYVPKTGEKAERLIAGLRELHARHAEPDGRVAMVYEVHLYIVDCETGTRIHS
jgi:SAM-dependent methyltransferase